MAEKKDSRHRTLTEARKAANKRYIDKFRRGEGQNDS